MVALWGPSARSHGVLTELDSVPRPLPHLLQLALAGEHGRCKDIRLDAKPQHSNALAASAGAGCHDLSRNEGSTRIIPASAPESLLACAIHKCDAISQKVLVDTSVPETDDFKQSLQASARLLQQLTSKMLSFAVVGLSESQPYIMHQSGLQFLDQSLPLHFTLGMCRQARLQITPLRKATRFDIQSYQPTKAL